MRRNCSSTYVKQEALFDIQECQFKNSTRQYNRFYEQIKQPLISVG